MNHYLIMPPLISLSCPRLLYQGIELPPRSTIHCLPSPFTYPSNSILSASNIFPCSSNARICLLANTKTSDLPTFLFPPLTPVTSCSPSTSDLGMLSKRVSNCPFNRFRYFFSVSFWARCLFRVLDVTLKVVCDLVELVGDVDSSGGVGRLSDALVFLVPFVCFRVGMWVSLALLEICFVDLDLSFGGSSQLMEEVPTDTGDGVWVSSHRLERL